MITSFWSPTNHLDAIRGLLSVSLQQSIKKKRELLVINVSEDNILDNLIIGKQYKSELMDRIGTEGLMGIDKLQEYDRQTVELITLTYLNDRFYYMPGSNKKDKPQATTKMIKNLNNAFKDIMLDLPAGDNEIANSMLTISDLVIVCLPQSKVIIENFLENNVIPNKNVYYLITDYNINSSYNLKNLRKKYLCFKNKITAIPYDINFLDAIYESNGMGYMQKLNINDNSFINSIDKASNLILNEWGRGNA